MECAVSFAPLRPAGFVNFTGRGEHPCQVVLLALITSLATRWWHFHCTIAYDCPIDIISWYS